MGAARGLLGAIVLALLLAGFASPAAAGSSGYKAFRTVSMLVPAVSEGEEGVRGVVSRLVITVAWPGSGQVYVSARPLTEIDTQASAWIAVFMASLLAGVDYRGYDFFVRLEADTSIVGGPSASGAITVAVLAALTGAEVPGNASMTGMVEPDGSLGPVGGVPEKLEAVAEEGVKLFVIPYGQRYSLSLATGKTVDVAALGERLGVRVVEAASVLEAYRYITGRSAPIERLLNGAVEPEIPGFVVEWLKKIVDELLGYAEGNVTGLGEAAKARVERLAGDARSLAEQGRYYAAASLAFQAAIEATTARLLEDMRSAGGLGEAAAMVERLLEAAGELLERAEEAYNRTLEKGLTDVSLQILVTARERIAAAEDALGYARALLAHGALADAAGEAVYAYYRSLTALNWAELAFEASGEGRPVDAGDLRAATRALVDFASTSAGYLESLGVPAARLMDRASSAKALLEEGDLVGALAATVRVVTDTAFAFHRVFHTQPSPEKLRGNARLFTLAAASAGLSPVLPLLYTEYGDALLESSVEDAMAMYEAAAAYALLLYTLAPRETPPLPGWTPPKPVTTTVYETTTVTRGTETTVVVTQKEVVTETSVVEKTLTEVETLTKTLPGLGLGEAAAAALITGLVGLATGYVLAGMRRRL